MENEKTTFETAAEAVAESEATEAVEAVAEAEPEVVPEAEPEVVPEAEAESDMILIMPEEEEEESEEEKTYEVVPKAAPAATVKTAPEEKNNDSVYNDGLGMKWYSFLIYFALFAAAVISIINGIQYVTGAVYDIETRVKGTSDFMYAIFPKLKTIDVVYGIAAFLHAIFCIVTRFALAKYKKAAPSMITAVYAAVPIFGALYIGACKAFVPYLEFDAGALLPSFVINIVMLILNIIYFNKRKHRFIK